MHETVAAVKAFAGMLVWLGALWGDYPVEPGAPNIGTQAAPMYTWTYQSEPIYDGMCVNGVWNFSGGNTWLPVAANSTSTAFVNNYVVPNGACAFHAADQYDARDTRIRRIAGPGEGK